MPFKSRRQERAAFSGALGPKMKAAASTWASETNQRTLPERASSAKSGGSGGGSKSVSKKSGRRS